MGQGELGWEERIWQLLLVSQQASPPALRVAASLGDLDTS